MKEKIILLVEDNPDDVRLTMRSLQKNNISNPVVVARDGVEALDYLFCRGAHTGRDPHHLPVVVLLDIKLPRIDGIEVLKQMRLNEATKLLPVVVLTSSREEQDILNPVDFVDFNEAIKNLGLYWLLWNEAPPVIKN
jgi:two-component system response regulator